MKLRSSRRPPSAHDPSARHPGTPHPSAQPPTATPDRLILDIEKVVAGGLGLARHAGGVVLVRGALGGEQVEAQVRAARGVRQGRLLRVLRPSPDRVDAPELPTTDLAHASYPAQLGIKRELVEEALSRIARLDIAKLAHPVAATVASPRQWQYRNSAQYLITPGGLAYRERSGPGVRRLDGPDPLLMEAVQAVMARLNPALLDPAQEIAFRGSRLSGEVVVTLIGPGEPRQYLRASDHLLDAGVVGVSLASPATQPAGRRFSAGVKLIAGEATILEQLGDVQVSLSASGFAQINPEAAGLAYRLAAQLAGSGERATDLYGGSGAIGRHLAHTFAQVLVLDTASEALKRGQRDVLRSGERNVVFRRTDADVGVGPPLPEADVIVVDPPRAGLSSEARHAIDAAAARTLIYVSCDPATWARDVGDLVNRGWQLGEVVPHDFYPQTSHVEVVSRLTRR
ncbi:class I SAM-dependent RNA methyltransferase [Deinococcus alpinitundrae]|uniref:class I SAM-dependent RNA methyltransferase n=1 Tax=Deinococcus alpinitundrae TaxID=468913 RepID=UPI00137B914C|nr:class I SAM-dependent RNA methyltransferase [Deinococcus alpinitundrae]